jgi:ppGpp synthetase/RelA/SpoT-type nucleotidyltranferase
LADGRGVNRENVFFEITDLAGVRVLHLHQEQFIQINQAINEHVDLGEWVLVETPKAYTWDPEAIQFFEGFGFVVEQKESFYTSVHYVVRPREEAIASCEIQVRTLFEEAWGEIDHAVNYPDPSSSVACQEQLKVLARLVSAGSRLADSIFKTIRG